MDVPSVISFTNLIGRLLPEPHAGLLSGILFGTKATLSKELINAFVATGTLHIVALSGMNITILSALVAFTLLRFVSRRIASLLTIGVIVVFVWFVGLSPSVIRAAIMGILSLFAVILGRQRWSMFFWILAVSSMLLLNPQWIADLSFQLSALATLGIILFGPSESSRIPSKESQATEKLSLLKSIEERSSAAGRSQNLGWLHFASGERLDGAKRIYSVRETEDNLNFSERPQQRQNIAAWIWGFVSDDLRVTLAAQVFTIPLIFWNFHRVSLISPVTNILIGWTIAPLTILGWLTVLGASVWMPLGQLIAWMSWVWLTYLISVVKMTAIIPFASVGL